MAINKNFYIGIDVGGTKIASVLLDEKHKTIEHLTLATPKDSLEHFLIMVSAAVDPLLKTIEKKKGHLVGIGIGAPGPIDHAKNQVIVAPNLPLLNKVKLGELILKQINQPNLPYLLDNDANCFVRAEGILGAGAKSNNFFGIGIGTGIGGGWWYNGDIYHGGHGSGSEPGHIIVDFDNLITLEQAYHKLTQNNPAILAEEAYKGDILAGQKFAEIGAYLGIAFSTIVNLFDPEMIILFGGALASSDLFLNAAKEALKKHTFAREAHSVKLIKGKLGPLAGAIGAALLIK
ncbi:MAG: ROK family protein [Candidatus Falkowbacteria bacterium]|nr:ROK family protein [Candidatus Falkowbacteria bacterium]